MVFALWSRAAVMQLVEHECGVKLSVPGIGNYLKRSGFTPQKPIAKTTCSGSRMNIGFQSNKCGECRIHWLAARQSADTALIRQKTVYFVLRGGNFCRMKIEHIRRILPRLTGTKPVQPGKHNQKLARLLRRSETTRRKKPAQPTL